MPVPPDDRAAGGAAVPGSRHGRPPPAAPPASRREIRSARFPQGLPDRCDDTVIEAFDDAWLLLEQTQTGYQVLGVAEDYETARAWLISPEDAAGP